jgi:rRNA maturation RNase YbeY
MIISKPSNKKFNPVCFKPLKMTPLLQFFSEEVDFKLTDEQLIRNWVLNAIEEEGFQAAVINVIFCNDEYLLDLNQRFLDRDTLTDVIAFDYDEGEAEISGDIFISIDRTRENALKFDASPDRETFRVIIHGVLHLCGYSDVKQEEKLTMSKKEDYYLSLLTL